MQIVTVANLGFGDVLWVEPVVQELLDRGHEVNLFVQHPCIFDNYPSKKLLLNQIGSILPLKNFPIKLNMHANPKAHLLDTFRKQAGVPDMKLRYPRLYLSDQERKRTIQGEYALIHLDSYTSPGRFPRNAYGIEWERVVAFIRAKGMLPLQISGRAAPQVAPIVPTKDFREMMSLLSHAKLFIGLDSGPSHIAASMRVPSVLFFGYVNPLYRHLDLEKKVFLQNSCPFAHCFHQFGIQPCRRVPESEAPPCCVHDADRVIQAIESVLLTR